VKITATAPTFEMSHRPHGPRAREFRIRGGEDELPFLENVHPLPDLPQRGRRPRR
jgi:pyruvate carboxylase